MNDVPKEVSAYMKKIGARGGAAGKGEKKKRTGTHYKKMVEARKRKAKRK